MKYKLFGLMMLFLVVALSAQQESQTAFSAGVKYLKANKFVEAKKQFSIAIEKGATEQGLKMPYIYKGFSFNGLGKYDSAIFCFDKAIEIDSIDLGSYTDRGKTYSYKKDYKKAAKDFLHVVSVDSTGKQAEAAYYYLGRISMLQAQDEKAIKYFDKLLSIVPTDAEAYFLRGTAKSNILEFEGSITDYDLAIKYRPNYMKAFTNRAYSKINLLTTGGNIFPSQEETKSACEDFEKGMELGDQQYDLYDVHCTDLVKRVK
ncbi:MAG: tetratricopeptide (TPR) repeat protein [Saprospiraceae bacterium]|jgi:tetratricopeptide (TPR) repeat protein